MTDDELKDLSAETDRLAKEVLDPEWKKPSFNWDKFWFFVMVCVAFISPGRAIYLFVDDYFDKPKTPKPVPSAIHTPANSIPMLQWWGKSDNTITLPSIQVLHVRKLTDGCEKEGSTISCPLNIEWPDCPPEYHIELSDNLLFCARIAFPKPPSQGKKE